MVTPEVIGVSVHTVRRMLTAKRFVMIRPVGNILGLIPFFLRFNMGLQALRSALNFCQILILVKYSIGGPLHIAAAE
jgi:hypothetical protein